MYFPVLAEYNSKNSEEYASLILILINEVETRFQDFRMNSQLFAIFATPFSVDITAVETKFQVECIELQSDIQLKEKSNQSSLLDFYKLYLPKETYPSFMTMPYSCSRFSAVLTFVNNCFLE